MYKPVTKVWMSAAGDTRELKSGKIAIRRVVKLLLCDIRLFQEQHIYKPHLLSVSLLLTIWHSMLSVLKRLVCMTQVFILVFMFGWPFP